MPRVIILLSSLRIRSLRRLAWEFCSGRTIATNRVTMGLGTTLLWPDMLQDTGWHMLSLSMCRRTYELRWNVYSIWTGHILPTGADCTTLTPTLPVVQPLAYSRPRFVAHAHPHLPCITPHCVDSKIWLNT